LLLALVEQQVLLLFVQPQVVLVVVTPKPANKDLVVMAVLG